MFKTLAIGLELSFEDEYKLKQPEIERKGYPDGANKLFLVHPAVLTAFLEGAWALRIHPQKTSGYIGLGGPFHRSNISSIPISLAALQERPEGSPPISFLWDHLIYAYMIENTRIYDVFHRVINNYIHGERLGTPLPAAQHWLRATEELFYAPPMPLTIRAIESRIRPDMAASRRNAYQRMFGMDLNHGTDENKPYPYIRADAANHDFVSSFEELLREVWVGIGNYRNISGQNPTDNGKIADLTINLFNMLTMRRQNGNLSREEFVIVSMMNWFHLTVLFNSPIVVSIRAEASSPEQRLFKIAQRVGLPAHALSHNYFEIAEKISRVLILIETGALNDAGAVEAYYKPGLLQSYMNDIITHWSVITGRDMKARKVAPS